MNNLTLVGNLVRDPEMSQVGDNTVVKFTIADNQYEGPNKDATTGWYNCSLWGKRGENFMDVFSKGMQVTIFGEQNQRMYTDKNNNERMSVDVRVNNFNWPPRSARNEQNDDDAEREAPQQQQPRGQRQFVDNSRSRQGNDESLPRGNSRPTQQARPAQRPAQRVSAGRATTIVAGDSFDDSDSDNPFS